MRVWLIVDYEPIPGIDGSCRYLRYGMLANSLASNGHDVTWWTSDFDHAHKQHRNGPSQTPIRSNLTLRMLPGSGYDKNISLERIRHNRSVARSFHEAIQQMQTGDRPDVFVACLHTLELSEAAAAYAEARAIPFVVDVVDIWPEVYLRAFPPRLKAAARYCLRSEYLRARRILQSARTLTAVSRTYLDWALALCPDAPGKPGAVFPLGYDDADVEDAVVSCESERLRTTHKISPATTNLAFVGQLSHSYDLDTVVEAARLLYRSLGQQVRFFIAGDGRDRQRLHRAAQGVPTIACTGWLSHPEVVALLRQCTVGLVSYAAGATQSLPYKPFEYMAASLALVSCLPGELEDLIRREGIGLQYTPGSPESLAACIRTIVGHPEHCAQMRRKSKELFAAEYRAGVIYSRFANYLESLVRARTDRPALRA
jgi:glycosyltransferase involved in cell wall biosynthesis